MLNTNEMSFIRFSDLLDEIGLIISDISRNEDVVQVGSASEIEAAKRQDRVSFLPTVKHLAIGNELNRMDVLYNAGIQLAGLTYSRKAYIGADIFERNDGDLSGFGVDVSTRPSVPPWTPSRPPTRRLPSVMTARTLLPSTASNLAG